MFDLLGDGDAGFWQRQEQQERRRAAIRAAIRNARLPNPEPAQPGRMSDAQYQRALVSAGDYRRCVEAEHGEGD
jgi:hypothetical protein